MKKRRIYSGNASKPFCILVGNGIVLVLAAVLSAIIGMLIERESIGRENIVMISRLALLLSVFIGIKIAILLRAKESALIGAACGTLLLLVQITITIFFYDGVTGSMLINSLIIMFGALCSIIFNPKRTTYFKRKKLRSR